MILNTLLGVFKSRAYICAYCESKNVRVDYLQNSRIVECSNCNRTYTVTDPGQAPKLKNKLSVDVD